MSPRPDTADPQAERVADLEARVAYSERTIEEMSDMIAAQWKEIERLTRELSRLLSRVEAVEDRPPGDGPEPPPPHY